MPPKGSTQGRGSGTRGRGRGRGRGKGSDTSAAAPIDPIVPSTAAQTLKVEEDASPSTLSGSIPPSVPQTAPEEIQAVEAVESQNASQSIDVDMADTSMDPNTSPASQPTETPAPTPLRPAPEPALAPAVLGEKIKKETRFKPRANRTAKSKLDELADQERKKKAKTAADEARTAGRAARGMDFRGMRGRGRGDAMGRGKAPASSGAGLWGVAPEMQKGQAAPGSQKIPGISGGGGGESSRTGGSSSSASKKGVDGITYRTGGTGGAGGGGSGRGGGGGFSGNSSGPAAYEFEPAYPDADETQRVNIARINESSDDEPIVIGSRTRNLLNGRGQTQGKGMKPVRLDRVEHKPRKTIEVKEDKVEDMLLVNERPKKERRESGSHGKPEPVDAGDSLANAPAAPVKQATMEMEIMDIDSDSDETMVKAPPSPDTKKKIERLIKKDDMPTFQSEEDRQEYIRTRQDRAVLADEIASMYRKPTEGDALIDGDDDRHAGRTFLFQFPPRIPTLYDPLSSQKPPLPGELAKVELGEDINVTSSKSGVKNPVDLTGKKKVSFAGPANPAERVIEIKEEELLEPQMEPNNNEYVNESGMVGRLVLRKSGKFEMLWGGPNGNQLAVNKGVTNSFMSVSTVLEHPDGMAQKAGEPARGNRGPGGSQDEGLRYGTAAGMGKVMGKFVVTPDWDTMF